MRRLVLLAGLVLGLASAGAAVSSPRPTLDLAAISSAQCTPQGSGAKLVVDVTYTLTNYADSGYADQWAFDTVHRHLRIWHHADHSYCAQIQDTNSTFVTVIGPSPGGGGTVPDGIKGTFQGGYITTDIVGKFKSHYPTHGDLGTFDAKCDRNYDCPGVRPSWLSYFNGSPKADEFVYWGWQYNAGPNGIWLDQQNVGSPYGGDIRG